MTGGAVWLSLAVASLALGVSIVTLWLTHLRRGRVTMTRPTVIYFGPDGSRAEGLIGRPKVFLRALLISDSKRGRIIQSIYATLSRREARQNFSVWVYGDDRLVRGSGLHINDAGLATNHHFLLPEGETDFRFVEGDYTLEVFAEILGDRSGTRLLSQSLNVTSSDAMELSGGNCGLYFDWEPQGGYCHAHINRKPPGPPVALKDALMMLAEAGANRETVPETR